MEECQEQYLQCDIRQDWTFDANNYQPEKPPIFPTTTLTMVSEGVRQGQLPTNQELKAALSERQRAVEKIEWVTASGRADTAERILSANATVSITLSLDSFAELGRNFRERQAKNGSSPKTPHLDAAILRELKKNSTASCREIWQALSHFDEGDLRIRVTDDPMEWDFLGEPQSSGNLKFDSFKSKVSRLRKRLR